MELEKHICRDKKIGDRCKNCERIRKHERRYSYDIYKNMFSRFGK